MTADCGRDSTVEAGWFLTAGTGNTVAYNDGPPAPPSRIEMTLTEKKSRLKELLGMPRELWVYVKRQGRDPFEGREVVLTETALTPQRARSRDEYVRERLGDKLEQILQGELVSLEREERVSRWSVHCCPLDAECRSYDAPARLHIGTPWRELTLALLPGAGYQPGPADWRIGPLIIGSRSEDLCGRVTAVEQEDSLLKTFRTCPLRRGHRDGCLDWKSEKRVHRAQVVG